MRQTRSCMSSRKCAALVSEQQENNDKSKLKASKSIHLRRRVPSRGAMTLTRWRFRDCRKSRLLADKIWHLIGVTLVFPPAEHPNCSYFVLWGCMHWKRKSSEEFEKNSQWLWLVDSSTSSINQMRISWKWIFCLLRRFTHNSSCCTFYFTFNLAWNEHSSSWFWRGNRNHGSVIITVVASLSGTYIFHVRRTCKKERERD